jgi:hypothetical protein
MKIGLMGLKGHYSTVLAGARELRGCEVVAVSDDDQQAVAQLIKREPLAADAQAYREWRHLLEHTMMDVCVLCAWLRLSRARIYDYPCHCRLASSAVTSVAWERTPSPFDVGSTRPRRVLADPHCFSADSAAVARPSSRQAGPPRRSRTLECGDPSPLSFSIRPVSIVHLSQSAMLCEKESDDESSHSIWSAATGRRFLSPYARFPSSTFPSPRCCAKRKAAEEMTSLLFPRITRSAFPTPSRSPGWWIRLSS